MIHIVTPSDLDAIVSRLDSLETRVTSLEATPPPPPPPPVEEPPVDPPVEEPPPVEEEPEPEEPPVPLPPLSDDRHAYFEALAALPECFKVRSLRDIEEVRKMLKGNVSDVERFWTYDPALDALRFEKPQLDVYLASTFVKGHVTLTGTPGTVVPRGHRMTHMNTSGELLTYQLDEQSVIGADGQAVKRNAVPVDPTGYRAITKAGAVLNVAPLEGLDSTAKVTKSIDIAAADCIPGNYQLVTPLNIDGVDREPVIITWDWRYDRSWRDHAGKMSSYKMFKLSEWTILTALAKKSATDDREVGKYEPKRDFLPPVYPLHHSVWTRHWIEILPYRAHTEFEEWNAIRAANKLGPLGPNPEDAEGRYHMVSVYIADENREAHAVLKNVPRAWPLVRGLPGTIDRFDIEMNTSDTPIAATGPLIGHGRNIVVLKGRRLDPSLLVKPRQ